MLNDKQEKQMLRVVRELVELRTHAPADIPPIFGGLTIKQVFAYIINGTDNQKIAVIGAWKTYLLVGKQAFVDLHEQKRAEAQIEVDNLNSGDWE